MVPLSGSNFSPPPSPLGIDGLQSRASVLSWQARTHTKHLKKGVGPGGGQERGTTSFAKAVSLYRRANYMAILLKPSMALCPTSEHKSTGYEPAQAHALGICHSRESVDSTGLSCSPASASNRRLPFMHSLSAQQCYRCFEMCRNVTLRFSVL